VDDDPLWPWQAGDCVWMTVGVDDGALTWGGVFRGDYGSFRPICIAAGGVEWLALGPSAAAHVAAMVALHGLVGLLLYHLARSLELTRPRAAFAALLFALAPVRLDAALLLHARCDLLVTALLLGFALAWRRRSAHPAAWVGAAALALLACFTKEVAYPVVAAVVALDRDARATWRRPAAAVAGATLVTLGVRLAVVDQSATRYALGLLSPDAPYRLARGALGAAIPIAEVGELSAAVGRAASPSVAVVIQIAVGLVLAVALAVGWRRWRPREPARAYVIALGAGGLLVCFLTVNVRTMYVPGVACALALAAADLHGPRVRRASIAAIALVAILGVIRLAEQGRSAADTLALRRRALAVAERGGHDRVALLGAPERVAGVPVSPVSECWERLHPQRPRIVPVAWGISVHGAGPRWRRGPDGVELRERPGEFLFTADPCAPEGLGGSSRPDVEVTCESGRVVVRTGLPAVVWAGGGRVEEPEPR